MNRKLIVHDEAQSQVAEAFRILRTNIYYSKPEQSPVSIMFTSTGPGEGKSVLAANTAVAFAQSGKKVILVDCDLRKPVQHSLFEKRNFGLTNALADHLEPGTLLQDTHIENLRLLTSGTIPLNPSELLGACSMQQLINSLQSQCDITIFDAPPVVVVTDASVLASRVDGVILVVNAGRVHLDMAQRAKELIVQAKGHLLGVVLNQVELEPRYSDYYHY